MPTCHLDEAVTTIESAIESDPLSIQMRAWLGCMLWLNRQYERAIGEARLVIEIDPTVYLGHWLLGIYLREAGLFEESIVAHRRALELSGESMLMLGWLGLALGQSRNWREARTVLARLIDAANRMYVPPTSLAWTHLGLGDLDNAFLWLDRGVDACDHMLGPIQSYPFLDPIRADPRYAVLLQKMNVKPSPSVAGGRQDNLTSS